MTRRVSCAAAARMFVALIAALAQSCGFQLPEGRYRCDDHADCPSGWSCHADARCYSYAAAQGVDAAAADSGKGITGEGHIPEAGAALDGATDAGDARVGQSEHAGESGSGPQTSGTGGAGESGVQDAGSDAGCSSTAPTYCDGDSPVHCVDGAWVNQSACTGATPICSLGGCVTLRLARGQFGPAPLQAAATSSIRLRQHALGAVLRACGETRSRTVCVTGSIHP